MKKVKRITSVLCVLLVAGFHSGLIGQNIIVSPKVDSLVKYILVSNKILLDPVRKIEVSVGKKNIIETNYYIKQVKDISNANGDQFLQLIIFGANRSHPRDYLLVKLHIENKCADTLLLGLNLLENDLLSLKDFYVKNGEILTLEMKREVLFWFSKLR